MAAPDLEEGPLDIADYGLISDCRAAALVGRNGAIDWLCLPRFDSPACFAALLGDRRNGRWSIAPKTKSTRITRAYRGDTMVLETVFETEEGSFALIDFMAVRKPQTHLVRIVEGRSGSVPVCMSFTLRFDYGATIPWVFRLEDDSGIAAIAGPNLVTLRTPAPMKGENMHTVAEFTIEAGTRVPFVLAYGPSHVPPADAIDTDAVLKEAEERWQSWADRCTYHGHRREAVLRSILTLKALTYHETGSMVAAPTTSLPERLGGQRNWDYRYCWLRDATLTLLALMGAGYYDEAKAWRDWLHRAVAGTPDALQIMYGIGGERRLAEWELPWLPGYRGAMPVRVGNAASEQLQLDVWGEMMDAFHVARAGGLADMPSAWDVQSHALTRLEEIWREPDEGIWEVRGGRQHFTHSKVMAWVAFDRSIRDAEQYGFEAPLDRWRAVREDIHRTVCEQGFNAAKNSFTQSFGGSEVDASLLLIPAVDFLPVEDPRVAGTIAAIEKELYVDGFVMRYRTESGADGLPPGEGVFLACSAWLADAYQRQGRLKEAGEILDRLLALRNDLGLLSEEYDPRSGLMVGNFPQAFPHLALIRTALSLHAKMPVEQKIAPEAGGGEAIPSGPAKKQHAI